MCSFQLGHSCSWNWITFCETIDSHPNRTIISGYITQVDDDGIDMEVLSVLKGQEERTNIRIWDGTDFDCNGLHPMNASLLGSVGDSIIVILPIIDTIENYWDVIGDYRMPILYGDKPLVKVENSMVLYEWGINFSYQSFIEMLSEEGTCESILSSTEAKKTSFKFFPNPTYDYINLNVNMKFENSNLSIFDVSGKIVLESYLDKSNANINVNALLPGIYFVIISKDGKIITQERIVKN